MLLVIDLGNINLKLGLYEGPKLVSHWRLASDPARMPDEYGLQILNLLQLGGFAVNQIEGVILACVVPVIGERIAQTCQTYLNHNPLWVSSDLNLGIKVLYDDPHSVGADRLADAAAVWKLYGGPACIIDFGTATTFNALTARGEYLGGAIMAGVGLSLDALVRRAAKLPPVELKAPPSPIGTNTIQSIQSGLIYGFVGAVEGMITRYRAELGPQTKVIASGGLVNLIASQTKAIQTIAPFLTMDGLRIIWELNH